MRVPGNEEDLKERLLKKAEQSTCKYRVSAIALNRRGTAIASAVNTPRFDRRGGGQHAEATLMKSSPKSLHTIIIGRIGTKGAVLPIDPCPACANMARKLGVKIITVGI